MVIETAIEIQAPIEKVWETFINLACWVDWNSVLSDVSSSRSTLEEGGSFRCCIKPHSLPVYFEPEIEEVVKFDRIIWTVKRYGVRARHEFIFRASERGTRIASRESFSGLPVRLAGPLLPWKTFRQLNDAFLSDIKKTAEKTLLTSPTG